MQKVAHIGFSGSRMGMSRAQLSALRRELEKRYRKNAALHHGDCVGADCEAHRIAKQLGYRIILHPPSDPKLRAFCKADETAKEKGYLIRNREIVDCCDLFMAAPHGVEILRSGTWSAIRYARAERKAIIILPL